MCARHDDARAGEACFCGDAVNANGCRSSVARRAGGVRALEARLYAASAAAGCDRRSNDADEIDDARLSAAWNIDARVNGVRLFDARSHVGGVVRSNDDAAGKCGARPSAAWRVDALAASLIRSNDAATRAYEARLSDAAAALDARLSDADGERAGRWNAHAHSSVAWRADGCAYEARSSVDAAGACGARWTAARSAEARSNDVDAEYDGRLSVFYGDEQRPSFANVDQWRDVAVARGTCLNADEARDARPRLAWNVAAEYAARLYAAADARDVRLNFGERADALTQQVCLRDAAAARDDRSIDVDDARGVRSSAGWRADAGEFEACLDDGPAAPVTRLNDADARFARSSVECGDGARLNVVWLADALADEVLLVGAPAVSVAQLNDDADANGAIDDDDVRSSDALHVAAAHAGAHDDGACGAVAR